MQNSKSFSNWLRDAVPYRFRKRDLRQTVLDSLSRSRKRVRFLQIGANDGVRCDPINFFIRRDGWTGVFVEPLPKYMEALKKNYAGLDGLQFAQTAISDKAGSFSIYRLDVERGNFPDYAHGASTCDKSLLAHYVKNHPDGNSLIIEERVPVQTVEALLQQTGLPREIDVICIDTEGHDLPIVKELVRLGISFGVLIFESKYIPREALNEIEDHFRKASYVVSTDDSDTMCYEPRLAGVSITDLLPFGFLKR